MQTIQSKFAINDRVFADGCDSLFFVITAVTWRHSEIVNYECSWVHNGEAKSAMIEGYRLTLKEN